MEEIASSIYGHTVRRGQDTLWIQFESDRIIACTSPLQGGIHRGLRSIFNHTMPYADTAQDLPGGSLENYLQQVATANGLDPQTSAGLLTAADMDNCSVQHLSFRQLEVWSVITAGVDHNGGRAGDPAGYFEREGQFYTAPGTINILLTINANLPPETLLKCMITATEAKAAALQELMAPSLYSTGIATGSSTDGIIVAADPAARFTLTDAGQHSKLGELIGRTTKTGVKKALELENEFNATRQLSALARLNRFGVDENHLWQRARQDHPGLDELQYMDALQRAARDPAVVAVCAALLHLQDELHWGLLPQKHMLEAARSMLPDGISIPGAKSESVPELLTMWLNATALELMAWPEGKGSGNK